MCKNKIDSQKEFMLDKRPRLILLAAMIAAACLSIIQLDRAPLCFTVTAPVVYGIDQAN